MNLPHWAPCLLLVLSGPVALAQEIVEVESGAIEGELLDVQSGLRVFRGVPYAAAERWRAPQPVAPWDDVRSTLEFAPACPQSPLIAMLSGESMSATSADCLALNVWTAAQSEESALPVLVWIHGGGLTGGWSSQQLYNGAPLALEGVVFVSINYRLGPLGFFSHPALSKDSGPDDSGNYGLLDQIAALEWVQRNIAVFGGDPERVTICGESAGATSVLSLCASPRAKGLFQGAIAQSPWITQSNFQSRAAAEAEGLRLAGILLDGPDGDPLEALLAVPDDALWKQLGYEYEPALVVGGSVLPDHPEDVFAAGRQHNVPLIVGTTADEGTVFLSVFGYQTAEAYTAGMTAIYGEGAQELFEVYPPSEGPDLKATLCTLIADEWFLRGTRKVLRGMAQVSAPAWQYLFTRRSQAMPALGAHHAVELPYMFQQIPPGVSEADLALARCMLAAWIQFTKTGDPNVEGVCEWPAWEPRKEAYLELGTSIRTGTHHRAEACDLLEGLRTKRMAAMQAR